MWEITGAEFSKSEMHTADGISIRFPRMTRIRDDKDWKTATNLHQLKVALTTSQWPELPWVLTPVRVPTAPGGAVNAAPFLTGTLPHIQRELRLQGDGRAVRHRQNLIRRQRRKLAARLLPRGRHPQEKRSAGYYREAFLYHFSVF